MTRNHDHVTIGETPAQRELRLAIHANREAVGRLVKYEARGWSEKVEEQLVVVANTRARLMAAWDAVRAENEEKDL